MSYTSAREHLEDHLQLVRLWLQRHARRHAERLMDVRGEAYTDDCVGPSEVRATLGLGEDASGQRWLDRLGFAALEVIEGRVREHEAAMAERLPESAWHAHEASLPLEELRASFQLSELELRLLIAAAAPRLSIDLMRAYSFASARLHICQTLCPTIGA